MHSSFQRKHPPERDSALKSLAELLESRMRTQTAKQQQQPSEEKRTLVVMRVSKRKSTTENQMLAMSKHLESLTVKPVIRDVCGTSWKKAIPEMTALMKEVTEGKWAEIHFWRVCRTGRSHEYDVQLWNRCVEHGCVLVYVDDNLRSDREEDRQMFYFRSMIAESERFLIAKRTREGIARTRAQAAAQGRPDPFPGRRPGSLSERTKRLIPMVLSLLRAGFACWKISEDFSINRKTVMKIRDMPIEMLRRKTGDDTLQPWKN